MSKIKLTLSIEESLIRLAKEVAKSKQTSVSELISSYLATFTSQPDRAYLSEELHGIAKSDLSKMTDTEIKALRLKEKYGV